MEQVEVQKECIIDGEKEAPSPEVRQNVVSTETTPGELKESGELEEETLFSSTPESSIVNYNSIKGQGGIKFTQDQTVDVATPERERSKLGPGQAPSSSLNQVPGSTVLSTGSGISPAKFSMVDHPLSKPSKPKTLEHDYPSDTVHNNMTLQ